MVLGAWSLGSIIGPVVGGLLVDNVSWRYCFHINYPFCGAGFVVAILVVRLDAVAKLTCSQKLKHMDWIGAGLFIGSMTSFLVGISSGGVLYPWQSAETLSLIIVGISGLIVFFGWEIYKKENTLLPMSILSNMSAIAAFYGAMINGLLVSFSTYPTISLTTIALHCIILLALPRYEYQRTLPHSSRYQHIACRTFHSSRRHRRVNPNVSSRTLSMGDVERLDNYHSRMWTAIDTREEFYTSSHLSNSRCLRSRHGHGTHEPQRRNASHVKSGRRSNDSEYVWFPPKSRNATRCRCKFLLPFHFRIDWKLTLCQLAGTIFTNSMSGKLSELGLPTSIAHESESYVFVLRTIADSPQKSAILESYKKGFESVYIMLTAVSMSALVASFVIKRFSMDKTLLAQYSAR